jgi:hypothetical protein
MLVHAEQNTRRGPDKEQFNDFASLISLGARRPACYHDIRLRLRQPGKLDANRWWLYDGKGNIVTSSFGWPSINNTHFTAPDSDGLNSVRVRHL